MKTVRTKPAVSRRRGPGRPIAQASQDQRERLLASATTVFSQYGIAATALNAIAQHAGVTTAMVHYYFKNRDQLLDAVVEERLMPLLNSIAGPALLEEADPVQMLLNFCRAVILTADAARWWPPLWVREVAADGGLLREKLAPRFKSLAGPIIQRIVLGQQQGKINPHLEARLTFVSLLGLTMLPLATAQIWRRFPGAQAITAETLARHVTALLGEGLSVRAAGREGGRT